MIRTLPISVALALQICAGVLFAAPAPTQPTTVVQPDGERITVRMYGDEFELFVETEEGYSIQQDSSGTWRYATRAADGKLAPSNLRAQRANPRTRGLSQHLRPRADRSAEMEKKRTEFNRGLKVWQPLQDRKKKLESSVYYAPNANVTTNATSSARAALAPATFRLAVLLIDFPPDPAVPGDLGVSRRYTVADMEKLFLSTDVYKGFVSPQGNEVFGSMKDYYTQISYGQFLLTGQVFNWVTADHPKSYYDTGAGNKFTLYQEALAKSGVNRTLFDGVALIYAGVAGPGKLWPASNGKDAYWSYEVDSNGDIAKIGTNCHEFGHVLGLSDLYRGEGNVGVWDLMGMGIYGGNGNAARPTQMSAWSKQELGWLTPSSVLESPSAPRTLAPLDQQPQALKILGEQSYLLIENRQPIGYDSDLPGHGILVWHVNPLSPELTSGPKRRLDIVEADNVTGTNGTAGTPFPGASNKTNFNCFSNPNSIDINGSCSVEISNISETNSNVSFNTTVTWTDRGITLEGQGNYPSLFTANELAQSGQKIQVPVGIFTGNVAMRDGIQIVGAGSNKSILVPMPNYPTIAAVTAASNTLFSGFSLRCSTPEGVGYLAQPGITNAIVSNNSFENCRSGVSHQGYTGTVDILTVVNNVFSRNSWGLFTSEAEDIVKNNVFISNNWAASSDVTQTLWDYNNYFQNTVNFFTGGNGAHDLFIDPQFVNAPAGDYRLLPSSGLINAGDPDPAFNDPNGTRNDIGAYGGPRAPIQGIDLEITKILLSTTVAQPGSTISITDTVQNFGSNPAGSFQITYFLAGQVLGSRTVPALAGGTADVATTTLTIPLGIASGLQYMTAVVDISGVIPETNKGNNIAWSNLTISLIDLVVTAVSATPATVLPGQPFTVTDTVYNDGAENITKPFMVVLHLFTDPSSQSGGIPIGLRVINSLNAKTSDTGTVTVTAPLQSGFYGTYYIGAVADDPSSVIEYNELNNRKNGNKIIIIPAPTVTGFWSSSIAPGSIVFVFGSNFIPNATKVAVNGIDHSIVQVLDSTLVMFMSSNATGPITVTTAVGSATSSSSFGIPLTGLQVTGIWPGQAKAGSIVFVLGSGFDPALGKTLVNINGLPCPIMQTLDPTMLLFLLPTGATSGPVTVTVNGQTASTPLTILP